MLERTLVILKPDCIQRGSTGEILSRFEKKGLKFVAMKMIMISKEKAEYHYMEHKNKPFFNDLVEFIISTKSRLQRLIAILISISSPRQMPKKTILNTPSFAAISLQPTVLPVISRGIGTRFCAAVQSVSEKDATTDFCDTKGTRKLNISTMVFS